MQTEKLKVAVIGVGKMGEYHLEKYLRVPNAEVVGFYEANSSRAEQIQQKYPVKAFSNLAELLFESDAVSIASPTSTHYSIAKQALEAGVHVLVEKPICEDEDQAAELIRLANQQKRVLQVGFVERFRLRKLERDFELSPLWLIEAHWLSPTLPRENDIDIINDLIVHPLDLVLSTVGEEPNLISATGKSVITNLLDIANIRLEFPSGIVANITGSRVASHRERRLGLYGKDQHTLINFISNHVETLSFEGGKLNKATYGLDDFHGLQPDVLYDQCESFVSSCLQGAEPVVKGEDGLRVIRVSKRIRHEMLKRVSPQAKFEMRVQ